MSAADEALEPLTTRRLVPICQVCDQLDEPGIGPCLDSCPHTFEFPEQTA